MLCGSLSSNIVQACLFAPEVASNGVPVVEFNVEPTDVTGSLGVHFREPAGEWLLKALSPHLDDNIQHQRNLFFRIFFFWLRILLTYSCVEIIVLHNFLIFFLYFLCLYTNKYYNLCGFHAYLIYLYDESW